MGQLFIRGEHARVVQLDETGDALMRAQLEAFREKFGREPEPTDPVLFDPDEDEPTPLTPERFRELLGSDEAVEQFEALAADRRAVQEEHGLSRKVGRNDPCPCGSGAKFKRCHGA